MQAGNGLAPRTPPASPSTAIVIPRSPPLSPPMRQWPPSPPLLGGVQLGGSPSVQSTLGQQVEVSTSMSSTGGAGAAGIPHGVGEGCPDEMGMGMGMGWLHDDDAEGGARSYRVERVLGVGSYAQCVKLREVGCGQVRTGGCAGDRGPERNSAQRASRWVRAGL
jgi:hypothetical protein